MKIFIVFQNYDDAEGTDHQMLEQVFATRQLAEDFVHYTLGDFTIEEVTVLNEDTSSTKFTKKSVADGKMKIVGKSFVFGK